MGIACIDRGRDSKNILLSNLPKQSHNRVKISLVCLIKWNFRGKKLTLEEKQGIANVTFAGGKDTVINVVSSIIVYFAENREALKILGENEKNINTACEEFVRYVSPLTAIARTCPHGAKIVDQDIPAGSRVGLCWPSANRDESVFEKADEVVLDRAPNPHIGFGFGIHNCLGAPQAYTRQSDYPKFIGKSLSEQVKSIQLIS